MSEITFRLYVAGVFQSAPVNLNIQFWEGKAAGKVQSSVVAKAQRRTRYKPNRVRGNYCILLSI